MGVLPLGSGCGQAQKWAPAGAPRAQSHCGNSPVLAQGAGRSRSWEGTCHRKQAVKGKAANINPKETHVRFGHRLVFCPNGPDLKPGESAAEWFGSWKLAALTQDGRACPRRSPYSLSHLVDAFSSKHPDQMPPAGRCAGPSCHPKAPRAPVPP